MPPIFVIIAVIIYGGAVIVSNLRSGNTEPAATTIASPAPTAAPDGTSPVVSVVPEETSPLFRRATQTPTAVFRNVTKTPTPMVPTATPRVIQQPTATPTPVDTHPPVIDQVTGPADGSTINFNSFCFPVHVTDNAPGTLMVRYSFNSGPGEWNTNYAPCYQDVREGWHTFVVQAKDAAGNLSGHVSRYFQVVLSPTPVPSSTE